MLCLLIYLNENKFKKKHEFIGQKPLNENKTYKLIRNKNKSTKENGNISGKRR